VTSGRDGGVQCLAHACRASCSARRRSPSPTPSHALVRRVIVALTDDPFDEALPAIFEADVRGIALRMASLGIVADRVSSAA
jgi:hypothetical protein